MKSYRRFLVFSFVFCLLLSSFPYASAGRDFIDDPDAIEDSSYSVIMLTCYDSRSNPVCTGSGFATFEDGIFVTNYHVIEDKIVSITAQTEGGLTFTIDEIIAVDAVNDVALLRTDAKTRMTLLPVGSAKEMKKGSKVVAVGSPQGFVNSVSSGLYSGYISFDGGTELLQFDASISEGSSGGALFNNDGEVIGITSASYNTGNNLNFAVPIEYAVTLWKNYNSGDTTVFPQKNLKPEVLTQKIELDSIKERISATSTLMDALLMIEKEYHDSENYEKAISFANSLYYPQALQLYDKGKYEEAASIFSLLDQYRDAQGYLVLCNASLHRDSFEKQGHTELTELQLERGEYNIDSGFEKALKYIGLNNAKKVILDVYPLHFLEGTWKDHSGNYFALKINSDYSGYSVETNLPVINLPDSHCRFDKGYYILENDVKTILSCQIIAQTKDSIIVKCCNNEAFIGKIESFFLYRQ